MPQAIRVLTRIQDQDDFSGSLTDGYFLGYSAISERFSLSSVSIPVQSVSNVDGTLIVSPTFGNIVASLALDHANTWTALQTFSAGISANITSGIWTGTPIGITYGGTGQVTANDG